MLTESTPSEAIPQELETFAATRPVTDLPPAKGTLTIRTRFPTLERLVNAFRWYAQPDTLIVPADTPARSDVVHRFRILLRDGYIALQGDASVAGVLGPGEGPRGRAGFRLRIEHLSQQDQRIFDWLVAAGRRARAQAVPTPIEGAEATVRMETPPVFEPPADDTLGPFETALENDEPAPARSSRGPWIALCAGALALGTVAGFALRDHLSPPAPLEIVSPALAMVTAPAPRTRLAVPPPHCFATIVSEPAGADVRWNQTDLGRTPLEAVEVPCGAAEVGLVRRQRSAVRPVVAAPHRPAVVFVKLRSKR